MSRLRFAAASAIIPVSGSKTAEAPLRAAAMMLDATRRVCLVACDALIPPDDVVEEAARRVMSETGVPFENLLVCATHTHHAPSTIDILGFSRDEAFCRGMLEAVVRAAAEAARKLDSGDADAEMFFAESQEATVGSNSRYLLRDDSVAWFGYSWEDVVRPTGPFDPDMAALAFRRHSGELAGTIFNHSVHNIGSMRPDCWSPGFYGLAAQRLERELGGSALFLPGAFGSSHNTSFFGAGGVPRPALAVSTEECVLRVCGAVKKGLEDARPAPLDIVSAVKRPFSYKVRSFDEAAEEKTVRKWTQKYAPGEAEKLPRDFREMRQQMAPLQGREQKTWLQAIRLGDVAIVGVPGELFASLGLEIRRRSPFRHTFVVGLANGTIGYIGDMEGHRLGGYQMWAGLHSPSAPGTGEAMVEQALSMLSELL